ncbi:hypothetical protein D9O50_12535 [Oxalobacteraceae bacterium CAVE-383]|nr:hypothetical protein D9O50_12535 [Oxalobacteraceae bacterium CAVE-383]
MKAVMLYEVTLEGMAKAPANYPAHRALVDEFHARGVLLMVGTFANPAEGAMAIFANRKAAEEFIGKDPFVLHGVVHKWTLREWNEVLA